MSAGGWIARTAVADFSRIVASFAGSDPPPLKAGASPLRVAVACVQNSDAAGEALGDELDAALELVDAAASLFDAPPQAVSTTAAADTASPVRHRSGSRRMTATVVAGRGPWPPRGYRPGHGRPGRSA